MWPHLTDCVLHPPRTACDYCFHALKACYRSPRWERIGGLSAEHVPATADDMRAVHDPCIRTAKGNVASPAQTRGSSVRSPSRRSVRGSIPSARGRAKTGRPPRGSAAHRLPVALRLRSPAGLFSLGYGCSRTERLVSRRRSRGAQNRLSGGSFGLRLLSNEQQTQRYRNLRG